MLAQPAGDDAIGLGETGLPCTHPWNWGKARGETFGIGRLTGKAERDFSDFPRNLLPVFRLSINQSRVLE